MKESGRLAGGNKTKERERKGNLHNVARNNRVVEKREEKGREKKEKGMERRSIK